jgi:DNA-binding XRE family transcriptional regulator
MMWVIASKGVAEMPMVKADILAECLEMQELYKDDPVALAEFKQHEAELLEIARLEQEEQELRTRLVDVRKSMNISQTELEARTGLSQQAISRFETGSGGNIKTILKYADGIGCRLVPQRIVESTL